MRLLFRFAAVAAVVIPSAIAGLAASASATPTISVESKCGYVQITVDSDVESWADMNWYGDGGSRTGVPVHLGLNVITLVVNESTSGIFSVSLGEDAIFQDLTYVKPAGCHQPILRYKYQMLCGNKALVTVNNIGDAPATHFTLYRADVRTPEPTREAIVSDVTLPIGTSYLLADKLTDFKDVVQAVRGTDTEQLTIQSGTFYNEPAGCAEAPKVTFDATCLGVHITTVPDDAQVSTVVKGQSGTGDRLGKARMVKMSSGEALLVKSGETVIDGFVYVKPSGCVHN